jgi:hypothetical protein
MYESGMLRSDMENNLPSLHWQFPTAAKFGRVIPKEKLYSQVNANAELKQLFVSQIAQIKWAYKLAENTINLAKTEQVEEIEVIQIKLKTKSLDEKLLAAIDKAIPHPTIFLLQRQKQRRGEEQEQGQTEISYQAAYKQKVIAGKDTSTSNAKKTIKATKEKWQHSHYLQSAWLAADNTAALPLPAATTLQGLYQLLLEALLPQLSSYNLASYQVPTKTATTTEAPGISETLTSKAIEDSGSISKSPTILKTAQLPSLQEKIAALAEIEVLNKQLDQVKNKRDKEKQFNRRQELNDQFKRLATQLEKLKAALTN